MTLPSTPRRAGPFNGNDSATSFAFTFKVFSDEDIRVVRTNSAGVETALTLDSDYSVTLNGDQEANPGGSVTYPISGSPLPLGSKLTIAGALEYDQPTDIPDGGNFSPTALENALDRIEMQIQQLDETLDRSVRLPVSVSGVSVTLPTPEADELLVWNSTGTALVNKSISELATTVAYANWRTDLFNGTGSQTTFTLTTDPVNINNLLVVVGGVPQRPGEEFTLSGVTLTFNTAPPAGTKNVMANYGQALPQGSVYDTSVFVEDTAIFDGQTLDDVLALLAQHGTVPAIAAVNVLTSSIPSGAVITALGRSAAGDGGGGRFRYDAASTVATDGGFVFAPTYGSGRFIREGWSSTGFQGDVNPRWFGAKADGTTNDSTALNLAISTSAALGLSGKVCLYCGTWKLNSAIAHNSKVEVDAHGALLDFSSCTDFAAWNINSGKEIRQIKDVLHGGVLKGVASPADGVYSATTVGIQFNTSQVSISNVAVLGFGAGYYFGTNAYVITLNDCVGWYNRRGWDADQTAKSNMGADLKAYNCLFAHNDYDVYNVLCESTFFSCALDNAQKGYVEENITSSGGANNGYLSFQSCRLEAGGDAAVPWIKNSGYLIMKEPKLYEPSTYTYLFDNSGQIDIQGGLARVGVDGAYSSRNTGSGRISIFGLRPVDFNGECFRLTAAESGVINSDFETGTTAGWAVTTGSGANMTCVTTAPRTGTYCLQLVSGGAALVAESKPIPIRPDCRQALTNVYCKNLNPTDVAPELAFYAFDGTKLSGETETLPGNTTDWTRIRFVGAVPRGTAYAKLIFSLASGQTAAVRLDDIYCNFA